MNPQTVTVIVPTQTAAAAPYVKTFKDTNYFREKTYKLDFANAFFTAGITSILSKTILAPLERWRIIAQTQIAYPKRPMKFTGILNYFSSIIDQLYRSSE